MAISQGSRVGYSRKTAAAPMADPVLPGSHLVYIDILYLPCVPKNLHYDPETIHPFNKFWRPTRAVELGCFLAVSLFTLVSYSLINRTFTQFSVYKDR